MNILIIIYADTQVACHEALSLALALASFDHKVAIYLGDGFGQILQHNPTGQLDKMLHSLPLYDIDYAHIAPDNLAKLPDNLVCKTQLHACSSSDLAQLIDCCECVFYL